MRQNFRIALFAEGLSIDEVEIFQRLDDSHETLADEVVNDYGRAVAIWAKIVSVLSLRLIENSRVDLSLSEGTDEWAAFGLRQTLLALSISSSKAALELLISGHFSISLAAIRHMYEISIQCMYLEAFPQHYLKWYDDPTTPDQLPNTPSVRKMCAELHKVFDESGLCSTDTADLKESLDFMHEAWHYLSKGSHPTVIGVYQVDNHDDPGINFLDAHHSEYLLHTGFIYGINAGQYLLHSLLRLYSNDELLGAEIEAIEVEAEELGPKLGAIDNELGDEGLQAN